MTKLVKRRSVKAGLPPGTLVYIGDKEAEQAKISVIDYDENEFHERTLSQIRECLAFANKTAVTWVDVDLVHQVELIEKIGECYGFHPLILEDILNTDQRPKVEDFGEYLYVVLRMLACNGDNNGIFSEQISIILGSNYVISLQEREMGVFASLRERLRSGKGRMRKLGADYLAYALLDAVVDNYFVVLEKIGERVEKLEEQLVSSPTPDTLHEIHKLKRDMIIIRKSVWPLREVIAALERGDTSLISDSTRVYLRDVYDHTVHVIDTLETFRDMVSGMLDIYLSSVSHRLNEVMKVLTIIATIFIPLTFIVGVYGMNFKFMPELEWHWGYPALLLFMLGIVAGMMVYFRKKRWI
ncbi:MAG: magnesium and cobalt transport protein CorA [Geobacteraceae bacterium]|nr:magnesium and cobalt transport protein CorA [Geobacteraceae bacterium]